MQYRSVNHIYLTLLILNCFGTERRLWNKNIAKIFSENSNDNAACNDPIILPQEPDQQVDECVQQQDWRVHGQEDNINESEDRFIFKTYLY